MSNYNFLGSFLGKASKFNREGHDVSSKEALSMPFANIVPLSYRNCVPNEHYKCQFGMYTQTGPMREDNFAQIKQNLSAVFVPLSSIWRDYISLTTSARSTRKDAALDVLQSYFVFNLYEFVWMYLFPMYHTVRLMSWLQSNYASQLDDIVCIYDTQSHDHPYYFSIDGVHVFPNASDVGTPIERVQWAVENMITEYHDKMTLRQFIQSYDKFKMESGNTFCFDALRLLDNLGYSNWLPQFEECISWWCTSDNRPAIPGSVDNNGVVELVNPLANEHADYIQEWLVQNEYMYVKQGVGLVVAEKIVSLLPFIAYRYVIDSLYKSNYRDPFTRLFTVDGLNRIIDSGNIPNLSMTDRGEDVAQIDCKYQDAGEQLFRSSTFQNELEKGIQFSMSLNDVELEDFSNMTVFLYLFGLHCPLLQPDLFTTSQYTVVSGSIPTSTTQSLTTNLVQTIADTSALYKLRQDLLRSGVRRDKQMEVMFGVKQDNDLYNSVIVLDKSVSEINIQGLINQAETEVAPLGARAARGNGQSHLQFDLDTNDFGYLFIIGCFTADMYYESFGVDLSHTLHPSSWFNPRNNHLGLEAVPSDYLSIIQKNVDGKIHDKDTFNIGFSSRDYRLKQCTNKLHGLFTNYPMPLVFADKETYPTQLPTNTFRGNAFFGGFLPSMLDQQINFYRGYHDLYYNPYMVNNIFTELFDGFVNGDLSYDHFRCIFNFSCHKVSPMPKIGLINLS